MVRILRGIFTGLFIFIFSFAVKAQRDLIITQAGEEIRCKILDETPTRFIYAYLGPKSKVLRNEIFKNLVSSFKYNYYDSDLLKNEKVIVKPSKQEASPRVDTRKNTENVPAPEKQNNIKDKKKDIKDSDTKKNTESLSTPQKSDNSKKKEKDTKELGTQKNIEDTPTPEKSINKKENQEVIPTKNIEPVPVTEKTNNEKEFVGHKDSVSVKGSVEPNPNKVNSGSSETKTLPIKNKPLENVVKAPDPKKLTPNDSLKNVTENSVIKPEANEFNAPASTKTENEVTKATVDPSKEKIDIKEPETTKQNSSKLTEKVVPVVSEKEKPVLAAQNQKTSPAFAEPQESSEFKNYLNYRVGVKGGLGNLMGAAEDTSPFGLYNEKLQRGYIFGADFGYFFKDNLGVGLTFTNYRTQNASDDLDYPNLFDGTNIIGGELSNNISQKFIGPSLLYRKSIDFKTFVVATVSPGMHFYNDKGLTNTAAFKFTGKSFGAAATLGLDFLIGNDIFGRDIILSLEAGYNYGQIKDLNLGPETGNRTLTTPISLNRLDFAVGLRFTRFPMYLR